MDNQRPSLLLSVFPIFSLVVLLTFNVLIFKDDASYGSNQIALLLCSGLVVFISYFKLKVPYKDLELSAFKSISLAMHSNIGFLDMQEEP